MSVKIMGQVWELDLPHNKAWVLMAMVDHADHIGRNIFPSLRLIAWKTGYSLKQVRRIVKELVTDGILIEVGSRPGYPKSYRADLSKAPRKPEYVIKTKARKATQNVPTQNGSGDMPREERKSSTPSQVSLTSEHEPSLDSNRQNTPNGKMEDLIKAWLDASKVINPQAYKNMTIRGIATILHGMNVTAQDVTDYVTELLTKPFYQTKGVNFSDISTGIVTWLEHRTPNGHGTDTLASQWDTDNEPIQQGVDYT